MNKMDKNNKKKLPAIWNLIKIETEEAALSSTIHGVGGIFRSKLLFLKITWFVLFLASSAYCAYTVVVSIQSYLAYEVVTNVNTALEIPTKFPKVTVCNKNPVQTEFGYNFTKSQVDQGVLKINEDDGIQSVIDNQYLIITLAKAQLGNEAYKIGLTLDDMLISCWFPHGNCNSSFFVYSFNANYGNCYSFNSGFDSKGNEQEIGNVTLPGLLNEFSMELYVGAASSEYLLAGGSGVQVYVNNQTIYDSSIEGISLPAGAFSGVEVSRVFTQNLPRPYSDCTSDEDLKKSNLKLVQLILSTKYDYKLKDCIDLCYQQYLIANCGCQDGASITLFPGIRLCFNSSESDCSADIFSEFYSKDVRSFCASDCPIECTNVEYILSVSSMDYPSTSYYPHLIKQPVIIKNFGNDTSAMTYEAVKRTTLGFSVHYKSLSYQTIEKDAKTSLSDLVGQIGGFCGLFVGMSFMSFFEIIELVLMIIVRSCQALFTKNQIKITVVERSA